MEKGAETNKLKYHRDKCKQRGETKHANKTPVKINQTSGFQKRAKKFSQITNIHQ